MDSNHESVSLPMSANTASIKSYWVKIGDNAFSIRTSLRLIIGSGPRELYREPPKQRQTYVKSYVR